MSEALLGRPLLLPCRASG